jgi:hypothetical protein
MDYSMPYSGFRFTLLDMKVIKKAFLFPCFPPSKITRPKNGSFVYVSAS